MLSLSTCSGTGIRKSGLWSRSLSEVQEFDNNEVIETYGGPEVRLSARYFLKPDFSVKASFNNGFQYIHTLSNNTTVSPTDTWKLSDINVKPQQANQYALGLYKNFEGNKYEISLEGYYKTVPNRADYLDGSNLIAKSNIENISNYITVLMDDDINAAILKPADSLVSIKFSSRKNESSAFV